MYVDALGKTGPYEAYLSALFPDISFTVAAKADQKYKIVGAASVAAKVTRDAWIEGWVYEERCAGLTSKYFAPEGGKEKVDEGKWVEEMGSGYPSGALILKVPETGNRILTVGVLDPKTQAWIKQSLEPTFGYPALARFSWATIKVVLEKDAHPVEW